MCLLGLSENQKREQASWELAVEQMILGEYASTRDKCFDKTNELTRKIVENLPKGIIADLIRQVSVSHLDVPECY